MTNCSKCGTFISNDSSNLPEYCPICMPNVDNRIVELLDSIDSWMIQVVDELKHTRADINKKINELR